jgi:phage tail-like protein
MPTLELPALVIEMVEAVEAVDATERLVPINRDPCPGELAVPIDTAIRLELVNIGADAPGGIDRRATQVFVDGVLAFDGATAAELRTGFGGPRATVTQTADALQIVLDPTSPLVSEATVRIRVRSAVAGDTTTVDELYSFVVEDRTAPRAVAAQALAPRCVQIGFSEPVQVVDPLGFRFAALDRPAVLVASVNAVAHGTVVQVDLDIELTPDARYQVTITGVTDTSGNAVLAPFDQVGFVGFRPARPPARRFDLWTMLPKYNRRADATGDAQRFFACLQEVTDLLLAEVDRFPDLFDLERAPEPFLYAILADLGNPFPFELDALGKRRLAAVLVEMYRQKGTASGIVNAIRFFLGFEVTAVRPFAGTALVLGESELGVDWELGPSNRFARYAFDVVVPVVLTDTERRQLRAIVNYLRPAQAHFVDLIEPSVPAPINRWELGTSELGTMTNLG